MSGEPRADAGPFLGSWSVVRCASSLLWSPKNTASRLRNCDPGSISDGATCVRTCSSVRKPEGDNFVSAKILPPIWLLWKLSYSCEVCHSAKRLNGNLDLRYAHFEGLHAIILRSYQAKIAIQPF